MPAPVSTTTTITPAPRAPASVGTKRVARYTIYNLLGLSLPLAASFLATPLVIRGMGTERFGLLNLLWVFIGYFSLFDFGVGRALTKVVAEKLGTGREAEVPTLVWSALLAMFGLGIVGGTILALIAPTLVNNLLQIPDALRPEALGAMYLLAFCIPVVIGTAALRGVLEASQHFGVVNAIRVPMGVFNFVGPLLALIFSKDLAMVALWLVGGRVAAWLAYLLACWLLIPSLRRAFGFSIDVLGPLLRFGGWMTVTNVVGPLMVLLDRFLIGAWISAAAIAYYATPSDAVTDLWLISEALMSVLFPTFSATYARDRTAVAAPFSRGLRSLYLMLFPPALVVLAFAHEGLTIWLGADFAQKSAVTLQWLAIGVFINGMARVPYSLLQAAGRPDVTARLHLVELPLYLGLLWLLIGPFGIVGAAVAWTLRMFIDAVMLFIFCHMLIPGTGRVMMRMAFILAGSIATMVAGLAPVALIDRAVYLALVLAVFCFVGWFVVLAEVERAGLQKRLRLL